MNLVARLMVRFQVPEAIIGDLLEGRKAHSNVWYWRQSIAAIVVTMARAVSEDPAVRLALAVGAIPTIVYILHDLVFQLPDNAHEATLGFFVTVAGLLCVWTSSGYIIARHVNGPWSRIIAGAVVGILSVAILGFTSFVLNNLFVDRMSYEPDRIRAFQQSGYATMGEYLHHQGWGPGPLLMLVAAGVGAIGAAVRKRTERRLT